MAIHGIRWFRDVAHSPVSLDCLGGTAWFVICNMAVSCTLQLVIISCVFCAN